MAERITVEVVCATPERQVMRRVSLPAGSSVMQAVEQSGILQELPEVAFDPSRLGIFSRRVAADDLLQEGDRVAKGTEPRFVNVTTACSFGLISVIVWLSTIGLPLFSIVRVTGI